MKKIIVGFLLRWIAVLTSAQVGVDRFFLDMRASFHQETEDGEYNSQMTGDYLNLHLLGHISPKIDYRIRQRLNKKVFDERNMFNATDFMYLNWQATDRLSFMAGKQTVLIGGYEYDAAPIDVYYYSQFCSNIYQCFTFGVSATYQFLPGQSLIAQVCNSPLSLGFQTIYAYNLAWSGSFAPWWHTIWSVNIVEDQDKRPVNYISLGNRWTFANVLLDLDVMNRAGFGQEGFLGTDMSFISKFIWSVGNWNICSKAGYEFNKARNIDSKGRAYDLVIAPGTEYFYAGAGLEWFPLSKDNLRLHAVYYRDNSARKNNLEVGVTWRADIIGKK